MTQLEEIGQDKQVTEDGDQELGRADRNALRKWHDLSNCIFTAKQLATRLGEQYLVDLR